MRIPAISILIFLAFPSYEGAQGQPRKQARTPRADVRPRLAIPDTTIVPSLSQIAEFQTEDRYEPFVCVFPPMPRAPGDLPAFIAANLRYPDSAKAKGIEGRVVLSFLVRRDGSLDSARVIRSQGRELDSAALRVVRVMPPWIPAKDHKGELTEVWFTMPITFRLD